MGEGKIETMKDLREACATCKLGMRCWRCTINLEWVRKHPYKSNFRRAVVFCLAAFVVTAATMIALPGISSAQGMRVGLEMRTPMLRTFVNFHEDQWTTVQAMTRFEFAAISSQPGVFTAKYSLTTGTTGEDTVINPPLLVVGSTDFSAPQQAQGGQQAGQGSQQNKSVAISWNLPTTHRVECAFSSYPLRPFVLGSSSTFTIDATGENKDGKVVTDTETIQRFSWGVGASYAVPVTRYAIGSCKAAFGKGYQFIEASLVGLVWPDLAVDAGYLFEDVKVDGFRIKRGGPFVGILWAF